MKLKEGAQVLKQTAIEWKDDDVPRLGAALAYYTVFSLAPLLVIAIGVAGLVFGQQAAEGQMVDALRDTMGEQGAQMAQTMLANAGQGNRGLWATIIGGITLLIGASTIFAQLQSAMNKIWEVAPDENAGIKGTIKKRLISMGMVFAIGFLLLVSLLLSTALSVVGKFMADALPGGAWVWMVINNVASIALITLFFAAIYKVLPDADVQWRDVWLGAFVTAVLFTLGKYLIGLYLSNSATASSFGAASSLIVILVWVYYSAQIVFFGAEFTQVYARQYGGGIQPAEGAMHVVEKTEPAPEESESTHGNGGAHRPAEPSHEERPHDR